MKGLRILGLAVATAAPVLIAPTALLAQAPSEPCGYGPHMMWGGGWYGMVLGPLLMLLMFAAAIATLVVLVRWLGGPSHGLSTHLAPPPARTPLDILKERFARGEIDKDEYEERRRVLGE
jgi:putative membrane protein